MNSTSNEQRQTDREDELIEKARRHVSELGAEIVPGQAFDEKDSELTLLPDSFRGYEIVREIHRGGQGVVYEAIQKSTKRKVAIKVLREGPFSGPQDKARFEREVHILGALNHPNIVTIHDSGSEADHFYFVMDYISGQPLDVYMASGKRTIEETLRLFSKICDAVNAAHLQGVIHRDLKPGNIRIDAEGEPHVLDFGLAKVATGEMTGDSQPQVMTATGQFMGSLPWASPEQAEGVSSKVDVRTDVYSLGVVLYQMLTGKFPYEVIGNMRDVLDRIMKAEPVRPRTVRKQIDDEVETIVLKSLSKQRERRYQSVGELARDVRHYLAAEPFEAKRDSALYVLRKYLKRHKLAAGVAGLVLFVVCVVMPSISRQEEIARNAINKAQAAHEFLFTDLLGGVVRDEHGRDITVHEVLDKTAKAIEGKYLDRPLVEATARETIGEFYLQLGLYSQSISQTQRALAIRERELGEDHIETLLLVNRMGATYERMGSFDKAELAYRKALSGYQRLLGRDYPVTVVGMGNLGRVLSKMGRYDQAESYYREALESCRRVLGDGHAVTLWSMIDLGRLLRNIGQLEEALTLGSEAVRGARTTTGSSSWLHCSAMTEHGRTLTAVGKYVEAESELLEAYKEVSMLGVKPTLMRRPVEGLVGLYSAWHEAEPNKGYDAEGDCPVCS